MKWLLKDGDVWLLLMLLAAGLMPVVADLLHHRALRGEASIGALIVMLSSLGLARRLRHHWRAAAVRRRMLP